MSDPIEPTGSEDVELQAAFPGAFPDAPVDPAPVDPAPVDLAPVDPAPAADPDFTLVTLDNGQREMTLPTGQVYRGKDDAELYGQLAKAQIAASRRITELSKPAEPVAPVAAATPEPEIDATAAAIADLMAPRFGFKDGAAMAAALSSIQSASQAQQEYMAAQAAHFEAQKFFMAVPDFSKTDADAAKIDNFLQANGIPFNANTAEMAYHTLKAKGEMTAAPVTNRPAAPVNHMPPPPVGTAPANTGKGVPTDADLWNMTTDQLEQLITGQLTQ